MTISKRSKLETNIKKLVELSFTNGQINKKKVEEVIKTLKTLSVSNAIPALNLYLKGLKRELDKHRLVIETPVALTPAQITAIEEIVERSTPVFDTEVLIKPELLAGFKIKIGDEVYEDSIEDRLDQLKRKIYE